MQFGLGRNCGFELKKKKRTLTFTDYDLAQILVSGIKVLTVHTGVQTSSPT